MKIKIKQFNCFIRLSTILFSCLNLLSLNLGFVKKKIKALQVGSVKRVFVKQKLLLNGY